MTDQQSPLARDLIKRGFSQDTLPNVLSRPFRQACPRDAASGSKPVLHIIIREDGRADFRVLAVGRTGVHFEISVIDIAQDKVLQRITEIEGRFADAIAFFQ